MAAFRKTRLAPSPTGALHLGHARTFLVTWWLARQARAQVVMRMEDLDASRRRDESVQQAYDDLRWLGMDWEPAIAVQSQRLAVYQSMLDELLGRGVIYPCICTRKDVAAAVAASVGAPHEGEDPPIPRYPGTCRAHLGRTVADLQQATGRPACYRFLTPPGPVAFTDLIAGPQSFDVAADAGDFPLTRFEGPPPAPAYQLAVVADDHAMDIDLVIRGGDLLSSTPRQLLLYRALGWTPPAFAHVPLVIGPDGKRLAKRHGESRIAQFRAAGVAPEKIVGWAAWRCGQMDLPRELSAGEMVARFDLSKLPRQPLILSAADLAWLT